MSQRYVALLDTGFPQTFIRRNVLDRTLLVAVYTSYGLEGGRSLLVRVSVWVGSCLARQVLSWVGSLSPPLTIAIFAHTGHI